MNEATRLEIVQRHQQGASARSIARSLGISRGTVDRVLARVEAARTGSTGPGDPPPRRGSRLDAYEPILKELLDRYPNLTVERALQELRARGFAGGYTIVRLRVKRLRPRATPPPVPRFETGPGDQAQMDHGVYDLDFTREGRRRVYLFSYLLGYSRRQYLRFVESTDLPTTLREHANAFRHLGGIARTCLYDNFKAVVLRHDAEGPLYNPKFLAFATHYGFRPRACRVRRPQTKGKVERKFHYVEMSLLNGRTFETLDHLNEVTAEWLATVADVHVMRDFQESPRDRHERERPHLLPLPTRDFDTALVVYRHVNVEGFLTHRLNHYSVPWSFIGQVLPVRIADGEVIVYSVGLEEVARHPLVPATRSGVRQSIQSHHPTGDPEERTRLLRQRFADLGPVGTAFLDGLLARQIQGKLQAQHLLALAAQYTRDDVRAALDRAVRFGAFSLAAVRRILAARARPRPRLDELAELHRDSLDPTLRDDVIGPRSTRDYQHLLASDEPEEPGDDTPPEDRPEDDAGRDPGPA
ncbi:IS21 family transposase [Urbifossiella limnaea]|uniref:Integrase core domain protein n=1 Tax=Urbifossiella limnaea TaxID=2528023 RepID=A0A517XQN5_9BACT|nr:IS21 family transposase [Urbifossiella limnaea]QDU19815.1 Integrase core domain protein [Urbifossiella limnaea]